MVEYTMINPASPHEAHKPEIGDHRAPELQTWTRRRLILKVTLFFICFVGVGLALLLLDS